MVKFQISNSKSQTNSKFQFPKFKTRFGHLNLGYLVLFGIWCLLLGILGLNFVDAQSSPQFMVSWQAQSYVPSWYSGKVFPTQGSTVEVSFELIDGGKIVDLSSSKVRWYVNDKLIQNEQNGLGLRYLKTFVQDYSGQETEIRITIVDYRGQALHKIVRIPVVRPEAVIDAPYPDWKISNGESFFQAFPFFFNVKNLGDLSFNWTVNNQPASETGNPQQLDLKVSSMPSGADINISVAVKNLLKELEFASKSIKLVIK